MDISQKHNVVCVCVGGGGELEKNIRFTSNTVHEIATHKHKAALIFKDIYIWINTYRRWIRGIPITFTRAGTIGNTEMESEVKCEGEIML